MDAGVPVTRVVAGVAMGLILDEDSAEEEGEGGGDAPIVLTDILGLEDGLGTMDFKVTYFFTMDTLHYVVTFLHSLHAPSLFLSPFSVFYHFIIMFQVAGDGEGISTFQLDIKCEGLSIPTLETALEQARVARLHILSAMTNSMPQETKKELPATVPKASDDDGW